MRRTCITTLHNIHKTKHQTTQYDIFEKLYYIRRYTMKYTMRTLNQASFTSCCKNTSYLIRKASLVLLFVTTRSIMEPAQKDDKHNQRIKQEHHL